jgi:hypothetical protein
MHRHDGPSEISDLIDEIKSRVFRSDIGVRGAETEVALKSACLTLAGFPKARPPVPQKWRAYTLFLGKIPQ